MFRHIFKVAWRSLLRSKVFTLINVLGLSIGMASTILIALLIQELMSIDQFHANKNRLYAVFNKYEDGGEIYTHRGTSSLLAPAINSAYPQVEEVVRVHEVSNFIFHHHDKHIESAGYLTDAGFLTAFSFPLLKGDPKKALQGPNSIVLKESFARKLFGDADAIGQTVRVDSTAVFTVTGIAKEPPTFSTFNFDYLMPYTYRKRVGWEIEKWDDYSVLTYVLLKPGVEVNAANQLLRNVITTHSPAQKNEIFLYPMSRVYLYGSVFENGKAAGGGIDFVIRVGWIGLFILLIACINYINLSTARSMLRAREVGIRKVTGASKRLLILQYLGEAVVVAALAFLIGIGIAQMSLRSFSDLVFTHITIPYQDPVFWLSAIAFVLFTGVCAGIYPALILSSYRPVLVLKGVIASVRSRVSMRKVLVVFQFTFAIVFIICTVVVYRQIQFGQQFATGYNQQHLAYIYLRGDLPKNYTAFKDELLTTGTVTSLTRTNSPITQVWTSSDTYEWAGKNENFKPNIYEFHSDMNFARTMGMKIVAGRDINPHLYPTDTTAVLLNEAAVRLMGFQHPVGQIIRSQGGDWHVVGVVKDFIINNPYAPAQPVVIQGPKNWFGTVTFRLNPATRSSTSVATINKLLLKYNPEYPSSLVFVDDDYQSTFSGSKSLGRLALLFATISIVISCLGLYGLALFMANSRVKEIGIRKVLGATALSITMLLSRDFVRLVLIAFVIASPVAVWILHSWLQGFTYRIDISWWIFALTGIISIMIALITIGYQAVHAALMNPVKNLRTE
jgi:ABC-type antimicrobial peptide transport system permease subunit